MIIIDGTFYYHDEKGGLYVPTAAQINPGRGRGLSSHVGGKLNPKLEDKANTILEKQPDLVQFETRLKKYVSSVGNNSKPDDWMEDLSLRNVRHDHLHMSSKSAIGYSPRMRKNKRVRYYYEG